MIMLDQWQIALDLNHLNVYNVFQDMFYLTIHAKDFRNKYSLDIKINSTFILKRLKNQINGFITVQTLMEDLVKYVKKLMYLINLDSV
jgi:hypothetical protein